MSKKSQKQLLEQLGCLLEAHGAEASRWPANDARELADLARKNTDAKRMFAEAEALDRLLAAAPAGKPDRMAGLIDRIAVRASAIRPAAAGTAEIVALPVRSADAVEKIPVPSPRPRALWPAFGALAASLIIGFYVGTSSAVSPALQQVAGIQVDDAEDAQLAGQAGADEVQEGELL